MKKLILIMAFMMLANSMAFGLTKQYTLVEDQSDKSERDDVAVKVTVEKTFVEDTIRMATDIKNEKARLLTKRDVIDAEIAVLDAELVSYYVEADKYEIVPVVIPEEEPVEEPIEEPVE